MTNEAKIVIESMRQAFETFADMELPIGERKCTLAYESVMALINGFDEAQHKEENLRKMIDRLCVALDTAKKERDAAIADLNYAGSPDGEFCSICAYRREEDCEKRKFEHVHCWQWRGAEDREAIDVEAAAWGVPDCRNIDGEKFSFVDMVINELVKNVPEWISVKSGLPDENEEVIVRVGNMIGTSEITGRDYDNSVVWGYTGFGADPEYWMPKSVLLEACVKET